MFYQDKPSIDEIAELMDDTPNNDNIFVAGDIVGIAEDMDKNLPSQLFTNPRKHRVTYVTDSTISLTYPGYSNYYPDESADSIYINDGGYNAKIIAEAKKIQLGKVLPQPAKVISQPKKDVKGPSFGVIGKRVLDL